MTGPRIRPMLATTIPDAGELEARLTDDGWIGQLKADGTRLLIEFPGDGTVSFWGRDGQQRTGIPQVVRAEVRRLAGAGIVPAGWVLDGEVLPVLPGAARLAVFDLAVPDAPFEARFAALQRLVGAWSPSPAAVAVLPVHQGTAAKRELLAAAKARKNEGIVVRRADAAYVGGRSAPGRSGALLRWKFTCELDAVVLAVDVGGQASAELVLLDPGFGRAGRVISIGTVGTEGKFPVVTPGQVWCVRASGTYRGPGRQPRLMHPRLICVRTDKPWTACTVDQLPVPLNRNPHIGTKS